MLKIQLAQWHFKSAWPQMGHLWVQFPVGPLLGTHHHKIARMVRTVIYCFGVLTFICTITLTKVLVQYVLFVNTKIFKFQFLSVFREVAAKF